MFVEFLKVWNLDNMDSSVRLHDALIEGDVTHMSTSQYGQRVVACGSVHAEARVLDLSTNTCLQTLEHTAEVGLTLDDVIMSPRGQYVVTQMAYSDALAPAADSPRRWPLLKVLKLWDAGSGELLLSLDDCRLVVFSPRDDRVVFFQCRSYSVYDWSSVAYSLVVCGLSPGDARDGQPERVALPVGDVIGQPVITASGQFLCVIMQLKDKAVIGTKSSAVRRAAHHSQQNSSAAAAMEIVLVVYSFEKMWRGLKYLQLSDIWAHFGDDDRLVDVTLFHEETLLLTYVERCNLFEHAQDGRVDRSRLVAKRALLYDVKLDNVVKRYDDFLMPTSRVDQLRHSYSCSYVMDNHGHVFSTIDNELVNKLDTTVAVRDACVFVLDGHYVAMLVENGRQLVVLRAKDNVRKARIFLHGVGVHLRNVCDDRTLAVGCSDGRVVTFTVVLDSSDPMRDVISLLPSRKQPGASATEQCASDHTIAPTPGTTAALLASDLAQIQITTNMQQRLSRLTRAAIEDRKQKNAIYKAVETDVALIQEMRKVQNTSAACCIQ